MPNNDERSSIKKILGLGEMSDEAFLKCLALGMLFGQAIQKSIRIYAFSEFCGKKVDEIMDKSVGIKFPKSKDIFSLEQSNALFDFFNQQGIVAEFLEWII